MIIAVDFDGTIVEERYPEIGKEKPFAIATLKQLLNEGHLLCLWTAREGELLQDAVEWCRERGIEFYAVNSDYPDDESAAEYIKSRKLKVDIFIDDRNIGGLPDWGTIYQMISEHKSYEQILAERSGGPIRKKKPWWHFL